MSTSSAGSSLPPSLEDIANNAEGKAREALKTIEKIAQSVDPVALFVNMFANMTLGSAEHISEATHGTVPVKLELLAYHIYPFFETSKSSQINTGEIQQSLHALEEFFLNHGMHRRLINTRQDNYDEIDDLLNSLRSHSEVVRGSAYPEQTREEIFEVQAHFDKWFLQRVNITPKRAVEFLFAIMKAQEENVNRDDFMGTVQETGDSFASIWERAKKTSPQKRTELEKQILRCPNKKTAKVWGCLNKLNEIAPSKLPVSLSQIAFINPTPQEREWNALCDLIGLSQESRKGMSNPIEVRQRPLFVLPDKSVLLGDISNALDCLWDRFEDCARNDQAFYDKHYQRRKADWLERKVFALLKQIFPAENVYHRLSYPDPDKLAGSTAELDFAIVWEPFILLVESKARQFRIESQLGDPGRLRTDIKTNVEDAYEQAKRALRYISCTERPEFSETSHKRKLVIEKKKFLKTYLLTISQHHLAGLVNRFAQLKGLGLFKNAEYPISICVSDFEMIAEFCSGPDIFLHYLERRIAIANENKVEFSADELDFFGAYLSTRLQEVRIWKPINTRAPNFVHLGGWCEKFDQIMSCRRGDRHDDPPAIELDVPAEIKEILHELRRRKEDSHARWIAFSLLNMSDEALNSIAQSFDDLRNATLRPEMFRRATFHVGDTVVSIVAASDLPLPMLRERTALRAVLEKYRRKATKSIGIGIMITDRKRAFDCAVWAEGSWEYNAELEKSLESEPPPMPAPGQKLPGVNDPCICGSGKKFKKCCLRKIEAAKRLN